MIKSNFVIPVFIFDTDILNKLPVKNDPRVEFIHKCLNQINSALNEFNTQIQVHYGKPIEIWTNLIKEYKPNSIYLNHDYEPSAIERDETIKQLCNTLQVEFHSFKDQCIFEKNEIIKDDNSPYTIYTPYSKKWLSKFSIDLCVNYNSELYLNKIYSDQKYGLKKLEHYGFDKSNIEFPMLEINNEVISKYDKTRDFPALKGTSKLGLHLRFGTMSIRKLAIAAYKSNSTYLNELIWRDFYMMILFHYPHVVKNSFKKQYDKIVWRNNKHEFNLWCNGQTGYPIVDAGMRELNSTGYMHNRVRMIVASFLTKHLLIDWRWGEAYFAEKLLDFDLAANNGGWQWAAGCGCDAAPYFRVFNPTLQTQKFDPNLEYIKKWVPELNSFNYPQPVVEHTFARNRVLDVYKKALNS